MFSPMLLTDCADPEPLLASPDWLMEEKYDGARCILKKTGNIVQGFGRSGALLPISDEVVALAMLNDEDFIADGELMADRRYMCWIASCAVSLDAVPQAATEEDKRRLFQWIKQRGGEGVVFKHVASVYCQGTRSPHWQRWKFYQTDLFKVNRVDIAKSTIEVYSNALQERTVSSWVSVPFGTLPVEGSTVLIRYDGITKNAKLLRAKFVSK